MTTSTATIRQDTYAAGVEMRKKVLGAEHVERSLANATKFAAPIQELVTEYCWGAVWTRPGLNRAPEVCSILRC